LAGFRPSRNSLQDVVSAAKGLLGCRIVRTLDEGTIRARIVETEAYPHDDPACHAFSGVTKRNSTMFEKAGTAYVYRIHRSICLNVVTGPAGRGEAILLRALEITDGIELAAELRRRASVGRRPPEAGQLANGPGKLCQALGVDLTLDGHDLLGLPKRDNGLRLEPADRRVPIETSVRIGISRAVTAPLRFTIAGNPYVSR
jgi:DNA-3-methyladenine glycosylase